LRIGGAFSFRMEANDNSSGFDFAGTYTDVVPNSLLEYSFGERTARVDFNTTKNSVNVKVVFDAEVTRSIEQQQDGWQAILNNLKCYIERHG
ncbi:MAG: SRPBCC domain-containing protein, partial [Thiobacillus sp.]